jgi:hypothetical protein
MRRITLAAISAVVVVAVQAMPAAAQPAPTHAQAALAWLLTQQDRTTGQVGAATENPVARSAEIALSLAAISQDPATFKNGTASLADYLTPAVPTDVGTAGELLLARATWPDIGPTAPLIAQLNAAYLQGCSAAPGQYGGSIFSDSLAILGLRAAGQRLGAEAVAFLRTKQNPTDHGWSFDTAGKYGSDSNTSAIVLQALLAAGVAPDDATIQNGFAYLKTQFANGGFFSFGSTPDPNSNELGIQAIVAAGLQHTAPWSDMLASAEASLASEQIASGPDAGALTAGDKVFATTLAAAAFMERPLTLPSSSSEAAGTSLVCPPRPAAPHLAQTGGQPALPLALGLGLLVAGLLLRRTLRRA